MHSVEIVRLNGNYNNSLKTFFSKIDNPKYMADFSPHPFDEEYADAICSYSGKDLYFALITEESEIIGYFMLRGWDEGYDIPAIGLCVLDEYQGFGFGKLIMNCLESHALLNGASKVMLKVNRTNLIATNLYIKQGFVFQDYDDIYLLGYKALHRR